MCRCTDALFTRKNGRVSNIRRCYVGTLHWPEFEVVFLITEMDSINDVTPLEFPKELRH